MSAVGVKESREKGVTVNKAVPWLEIDIPEEYIDEGFYKIFMFFVFYSPCKGQSNRRIPLESYGWKKNPWASPAYLKDKLSKIIFGDEEPIFYFGKNVSEFNDIILKNAEMFGNEFYLRSARQRIAVKKACDYGEYMSLFYHIRNCLAHGRIVMFPATNNDVMYIMEDITNVRKRKEEDKVIEEAEIIARIVLLKSSLLAIINRLQTAPEEEKNYEEDVLNLLKEGYNTKKSIMNFLEISEKDYRITMDRLKSKELIYYCNNKYWELKEKSYHE